MPTATTHPTDSGRTSSLRFVAALLVSGLLVFTAACSDDDDPSTASTTTTAAGADPDERSGEDPTGATEPDGSDPDDSSTTEATGSTEPTTDELPELSAEEQPYADAVISDMDGEPTAILPGVDNECLAVRWVDVIGGDALAASGLTPEEFAEQGPPAVGIDRPTAEAMIDAMGRCGAGLDQLYEEWTTSIFGIEPGMAPEVTECMKEALDMEDFRRAMVETFMGEDTDQMDDLQASLEGCLPEEG